MSESTRPTAEKRTSESDDDLDDLDDVLSKFDGKKSKGKLDPGAGQSGRPRTNTRVDQAPRPVPGSSANLNTTDEVDEDALTAEFAKELAKGMESLMNELTGEADGKGVGEEGDTDAERQAKMLKAAWEAMLVEGMNGAGDGSGEDIGGEVFEGNKEAAGFQDRLKQAMNKMKEGETTLQGEGAKAGSTDQLEELLKTLGDLGLSGEGGGDEKELAGFLENMMGQLMCKDVLYEPLKELKEAFPGYLEKPPAPLSTEDREKYKKQHECVTKIIAIFDKKDYDDEKDNKEIVDLMSEMQSYGTPPAEIMGPLPPGFDPASEDGCNIA